MRWTHLRAGRAFVRSDEIPIVGKYYRMSYVHEDVLTADFRQHGDAKGVSRTPLRSTLTVS